MSGKIILDLCGGTGAWSSPYKEAGYDVRLITLPDNDVRTYIPPENVYGILTAPPCQMFSFARTRAKTPRDLHGGMEVVQACLNIIWSIQYKIHSDFQQLPELKFWCMENPTMGMLSWFLGKPNYTFNPYEVGDMYKKSTGLWGYYNAPVKTNKEKPKQKKFDSLLWEELKNLKGVNDMELWKNKNQRQALRAVTPQGFARAFFEANQ